MMKCFYLLLLVAATQARVARDAKDLPAPTLVRLTALDGPAFSVEWTPVKSPDSSDPVLGYKVKIWEQKKVQQFHYENVNGGKVLVEENVPVKFPNNNQIPEGKPKEILIDGADKTYAKMDHIEVGVTYEARVQAYTKSGDGPLSLPMRIQILPDDKDHQKDVYTVA